MSLERDISLLSRIPLFDTLSADHLRLLAFSAVRLDLSAGSTLFEKGSIAKSGYVVARGAIDLVEGSGSSRRVAMSCPVGTLIGEIALFIETKRPATAIATADSQLIDLSRALITRMITEYPQVAGRLQARLAGRLRGTIEEMAAVREALDATGFGESG